MSANVDDLIHRRVDFSLPHAENRPVQVDVLPSRQLVVKPRSHFEQSPDSAVDLDCVRWSGK